MAKRRKEKQSEHDRVVKISADTYLDRPGVIIYTNTADNKEHEYKGEYPDVIVVWHNTVGIIEEIETEDSVTEEEKQKQWKPYSKLGPNFRLVVPIGSFETATELVQDIENLKLQWYEIREGKIRFSTTPDIWIPFE